MPAEAETTLSRIRDIQNDVASDRTSESISQQIPALTREIDARMRETRSIVGQRPAIEILGTLRAEWQRLRRELSAFNHDLSGRATYLERDIEEIDRAHGVWTQTLDAAASSDAPAEVVRRIREVIAEIAETRQAVAKDRATTLTTQTRLAAQDARIIDALALITRARDRTLGRLFTQDSPPIWRSQVRSPQNLQAESLTSFSTQWRALGAYLERQLGRLLLGVAIFLALAAIFTWARRHTRSLAADSPAAFPESHIFEMPLAAVPSVIILRRIVRPHFTAMLYALIAFYLVDQLRTVAAAVPTVPRWLFTAEMLGSTIFLIWLMRDLRSSPDSTPGEARRAILYRAAAGVALFVSLMALIGNVFGYLTLANLIGNALLASAYLPSFCWG